MPCPRCGYSCWCDEPFRMTGGVGLSHFAGPDDEGDPVDAELTTNQKITIAAILVALIVVSFAFAGNIYPLTGVAGALLEVVVER